MRFSDLGTPLATEIQREMAASYFAACKKMVSCLEALKVFDHAHASAALTQDQITRRSDLFEKAVERVHFVIIQREALELSGDEAQFFRDYAIPEEIRMHLKPKRLSNEGSNYSPA